MATQSPIFELANCSPNPEVQSTESKETSDNKDENEIGSENMRQKLIFDSIGVQFCVEVFFRQLLAHLCIPLLFVLLPNPQAQGFTVKSTFYFINSFIFPFCVYMTIVAYYSCSASDREILGGAQWMPLIYFIQHRVTVALKYATLSDTEYNRFMECHDPKQSSTYQYQMQLLGGWFQVDKTVVEFELRAAAARVGARIKQIEFIIPPPTRSKSALSQLRNWNAFIQGDEIIDITKKMSKEFKIQDNGCYMLSVYDYCLAIIQRPYVNNYRGIAGFLILLFALLNLAIPFMTLANTDQKLDHSGWLACFYLSSSLINLFFGMLVYCLLFVAIFDVTRQLELIKTLHTMIRLTDLRLATKINILPILPKATPMLGTDRASTNGATSTVPFAGDNSSGATTSQSLSGTGLFPQVLLSNGVAEQNTAEVRALESEFADPLETNAAGEKQFREVYDSDSDDEIIDDYEKNTHKLQNSNKGKSSSNNTNSNSNNGASGDMGLQQRWRGNNNNNNTNNNKTFHSVNSPSNSNRSSLSKQNRQRRKSSFFQYVNNKLNLPLKDPPITHSTYYRSSIIGEQYVKDQDLAVLPRIIFDYPENVISWTYARLIMQNFGERFRFRIDIYVGGMLVLLIALMVFALVTLILAKHRSRAFKSNFFLQALLAVTMALIFLMIITYQASLINEELAVHNRTLASHALRVRSKMVHNLRQDTTRSEQKLEQLTKVSEYIDASMDVLDVNTNLKPFKIFGFAASNALTVSIATTGVSFYFVLLNIYTMQDTTLSDSVSSI